jgi:hypothetical protein
VWRGSTADFRLQFSDGAMVAASIVKTGKGNGIYVDLFWSLGFFDSGYRW